VTESFYRLLKCVIDTERVKRAELPRRGICGVLWRSLSRKFVILRPLERLSKEG